MKVFSQTRLPTQFGDFQCMVFIDDLNREHVALVKGNIANQSDVLCRLHSECLTSEVFGSLKCDCKLQLDKALSKIAKSPKGVLLYLRQEGRGIGLGNKIKAYALQESGLDTVDANLSLGLPEDARCYKTAAQILRSLKIKSVLLMTNNPKKLKGLNDENIPAKAVSHIAKNASELARSYLKVKESKMGHMLEQADAT